MRKFLLFFTVMTLCLGVAAIAMAERINNPSGAYMTQVFSQYTGLGSTARYSAAQKVDRNTKKTAIFVGYSTNGTDTLASLPGTATLQCAPTSSGPWVTSKDVGANAVSATTSTLFNVDSYCQYVRGTWTKTGSGARSISMWLLYGD